MSNKIIGISITIGLTLGTLGLTLGQQPINKNAQKVKAPLTPELEAKLEEIYRLNTVAQAAMNAGDYEEAETEARQSVATRYGSGLGQKLLAQALYAQGKQQEAFQAYKVIADAGGEDATDLLPYSLLLLKSGQWAEAVKFFNKSQVAPNQPIVGSKAAFQSVYGHFSLTLPQPHQLEVAVHLALGIAYDVGWVSSWQNTQALHEYQQALALDPNSAVAHLFYGHRLLKLRRLTEARAALAQAAQMGNEDVKRAAQQAMR